MTRISLSHNDQEVDRDDDSFCRDQSNGGSKRVATIVLKYIGCPAACLLSDPKNCAGGGRGLFWGVQGFFVGLKEGLAEG